MARKPIWTNKSVIRFARDEDPIEKISRTARDIVLRAIEQGWEGPPFDPTELATSRDIQAVPCHEVKDARILVQDGRFRIEYNPNRPPHRVRYSIAHEIAHTLFPDCDREVRHREKHERGIGDEWQLEALCNVAAAEILMPAGSLPDLGRSTLSVDELVRLRQKFHVGTEAMAIRLVQLTPEPCAMFCASRPDGVRAPLQVDYTIGSRAWRHPTPYRHRLPRNSVASQCMGIEHTWAGTEDWGKPFPALDVEAIGIPPYPGSRYPRVVGLAKPAVAEERALSISYVRGDATQPRGDGSRLIVHVVHDATPNWGGQGFAKSLARRYPDLQAEFRAWASSKDLRKRFGEVHYASLSDDTLVASMVCQHGYRPSRRGTPLVRYGVMRDCLSSVAHFAAQRGMTVHMPRIGTGAAGGRWSIVEELVESTLIATGIPVTVYDLPGAKPQPDPQLSLLSLARA